jgi:hypothetical protein
MIKITGENTSNEWREAYTTLHVEEDTLDHVQVGSEPKTGQMVLVVIKNRTKKRGAEGIILPDKSWDNTSIRPRYLPSKSYPLHYSPSFVK